jgi:3-oxoacyl-[acyl-carrier-protein] synthase III
VKMRMTARIEAITYHVPDGILGNEDLEKLFPEWPATRIFEKTGIRRRHILGVDESVTDLAVKASQKLLNAGLCKCEEIDYLLLVTQSPDFVLPGSASLIQNRLGLRRSIGAIDINLGCSGYIYGLSVAKGLIESGQCEKVLLVTAETYSRYLKTEDKSTRTLFGDAAAATLVSSCSQADGDDAIGSFVFGTDGNKANKLILRHNMGGAASPPETLFMDGPAIFDFTLNTVPETFKTALAKGRLSVDSLDFVVFHQANLYILEELRKRCGIPHEKFVIDMEEFGNTVSATIPIALSRKMETLERGRSYTCALVGFGVGLSWGACILRICSTH